MKGAASDPSDKYTSWLRRTIVGTVKSFIVQAPRRVCCQHIALKCIKSKKTKKNGAYTCHTVKLFTGVTNSVTKYASVFAAAVTLA